ncbi:amidohydrolase family protein [Cyclobacteriaceae bacterium]|jgi:imidazolonepropionase-like amidohydrolase|nr:amidohydrolase family protein [Cyclobacteriaceae bacterium]MDC1516302.1 amidohydrolase family protein [Cyclobacteriaceae bacterium]
MKKIINLSLGIWMTLSVNAQVPAPSQDQPILLVGGLAHIGNGEVIQNSLIGFDNGKIILVAESSDNVTDSSGYKVINITGKHVYPGFILPNSQIGLQEVSAIRAMSDMDERGEMNPNVRSVISYNTDSEFIPTFRFNGILSAETTPVGGRISGTSSVMEMEGWNWEDAAHTVDMGIHMNWPSKMNRKYDYSTYTAKMEPNIKYNESIATLKGLFEDALAYGATQDPSINLKLAALQGLFNGNLILFIHAGTSKEIIESVLFAKDIGIQKMVIIAGSHLLNVAGFLKEHNIGVIIPPTHSMPSRVDEDVYGPYKLPAQLFEAGLTVSLSHRGMLAHGRNLPFFAGTAAAYGLDKEEALKMITSNTAKLLGIDDRLGSLTVGKDATLFVSEGDALDFRTNILSHAFISGKQVTLDNKQQELYQRFSKKYGHID